MTQGLGGNKSNQNANVMALLREFQAEYGTYGGENPSIQTLITYKVLKGMTGGITTPANATSGGIASTVTIKGSTGQTVLTDANGAIVVSKGATEDTLVSLLNRNPALVSGRVPVAVPFPSNQAVTVINQLTGLATEQTLGSVLSCLNSSLKVDFPVTQHVLIDNPLTDHATEATLSNLLDRLPEPIDGKLPVSLSFPATQRVVVENLSTDSASEQTLQEILGRLPELEQGKLPVAFTAQANISGFSTEETLQALVDKTIAPIDGKIPVTLSFPCNQQVTVSNQLDISALGKETTLTAILNKLPTVDKGKVPVSIEFPVNQNVTVSNQLDVSTLGKDSTLVGIFNKLPSIVDGKIPVSLAFPQNQTVTVSNQPAPLDISGLSKDSTLASILAKLPNLIEGKTPVVFPANQMVTVSNPSDMSALGKDATLTSILNKLPPLTNGKVQVLVDFPTNQQVTVSNQPTPLDISALGKDATLASILAKLPTLTNGKAQVIVDFPQNQQVTVSNQPAPLDLSALGKDSTLSSILAKLPALVNGKTQVDFPANQTVTVSNPSDVSALGKESTLTSILNRLPVDISKAIALGIRAEFTNASPLATALAIAPLTDSPLWAVTRTKKVEGQDAFTQTFLGRRTATFSNNGFTDIAEFDLQTVGNNLRSPTLVGTQTLEIVSSNAADNASGTGIRTVEVMYLDENFTLKSTSVTLNGVTAVQIQKDGVAIKPTCIYEVQATSHGSAAGAVGTITVRIPTGGLLTSPTPVDQISVGFTSSFSARACVPDGYFGYVVDVTGVAITANHEFHLLATVAQSDKRLIDGVFNSLDFFTTSSGTTPVKREQLYYELPSRCRVRLASRASAATAGASGGFTMLFVKKPV